MASPERALRLYRLRKRFHYSRNDEPGSTDRQVERLGSTLAGWGERGRGGPLEMLGAIADELATRGYSILLSKTTHDPTELIAGAVASRRVDGVIVIGQSLHHEHLNKLADAVTNMAVWGAQIKGQWSVTVGVDTVRKCRNPVT